MLFDFILYQNWYLEAAILQELPHKHSILSTQKNSYTSLVRVQVTSFFLLVIKFT